MIIYCIIYVRLILNKLNNSSILSLKMLNPENYTIILSIMKMKINTIKNFKKI